MHYKRRQQIDPVYQGLAIYLLSIYTVKGKQYKLKDSKNVWKYSKTWLYCPYSVFSFATPGFTICNVLKLLLMTINRNAAKLTSKS